MQLYKNGGVGALNDMGTQEAAVHAERWCWVVVTRKKGARYLVITPRGRLGAGSWSRARGARRAPSSSTQLDAGLILYVRAPTLMVLVRVRLTYPLPTDH